MKNRVKIFIIISMALGALSSLSSLLSVDMVIQIISSMFSQFNSYFPIDNFRQIYVILLIIELVACLIVGIYALLTLKNANNRNALIAPGVLLILFNGLFGIIAAIMMFCAKPEDFNDTNVNISNKY